MSDLRVAIVHYHLRGGGVTRVIAHAVQALRDRGGEAVVVVGEAPAEDTGLPVRVVEGLGYGPFTPGQDVQPLLRAVDRAVQDELGRAPDLWHVHNHSLGKNALLPVLVERLAERGSPLVLQIHDFAEDGRPANYRGLLQVLAGKDPGALGSRLYPQATHVHYALLNARDRSFLAAAGAEEHQLHLLPNAVCLEAPARAPASRNERLFLYPTRAIRRKNLGEFLLWAALAEKGDRFATSLIPQNPEARPIHDSWQAFAEELNLPVAFGIGPEGGLTFPELVASAHACITTSVAEGFGLAFLEPWLVGQRLVGRRLPEITDGFETTGVDLGSLYTRLDVPLDWVGEDNLRERLCTEMSNAMASYGRELQDGDVDRTMAAAVREGCVDLGRLDEGLQQQVIRCVRNDPACARALLPNTLPVADDDVVAGNGRAVTAQYSLARYGKQLLALYEQVAASAAAALGPLDADILLDQFLAPQRFCLLRT